MKKVLQFGHTCCLDKSVLETCLRFLVSENCNRKLRLESSVSFLFVPQFNSMLSTNTSTQHTNSCRQHVLNLHVLVSLCLSDLIASSEHSIGTQVLSRSKSLILLWVSSSEVLSAMHVLLDIHVANNDQQSVACSIAFIT